MAEPEPLRALDDLRQDSTRGAAEIAAEARSALARLAGTEAEQAPIREAVLALVDAHPSMAPLVHLADETLRGLDEGGLEALRELPRESPREQRIARRVRAEIAEAGTVLTHSRSGTVLAALQAALADAQLRVLLGEARPGGEGLGLARELAEAGADVELTYDAALFSRVEDAELVLVGADALTADALVNKMGTRVLLAQARRAGTSSRVLASSDKLWPASLPAPSVEAQAAWRPEVPEGVEVDAPLFERVPLALADEIVTEEGSRSPSRIRDASKALGVHPRIRDVF